jgi:signal transduction histidine kinase
VRASVVELGSQIDRWLRAIVLSNDLDRGAIDQVDPKSGRLIVRHSWSRGHLVKLPIGLELAQPAPWFAGVLMKGKPFVFTRRSELPEQFFASDWKTFRRYVPKSHVSVPLRIGGQIVGAVGFATVRRERSWSPRFIRRVQMVAEIFGGALERRYKAEETALLRDELHHLSRASAMAELSASIAHQLNQPIAAVLSNAEAIQSILESGPPNLEEVKATVADIIHDNLRAAEIIKSLRDFFRKRQIDKARLDIVEVVAEVMRMVRSDALFRSVALAFQAPSAQVHVDGDRIQLQQAVLNLVLNAFDAISGVDVKEVLISIATDSDYVRVSVRDSGSGIDPGAVSHLFEPFFSTKSKGMGMGLTIARSIVSAHGGEISAERNPDRGSTFQISLPVLKEI